MVRFVKASMKGWDYALAHPDEAAQIVVDNGGQDLNHQKYMMGEVAKLTDGGNGVLNEAAYQRTEQALLDQKIITKKPTGAWTHDDHRRRRPRQVISGKMGEMAGAFGRPLRLPDSVIENLRVSAAAAACRRCR